MMCDECGLRPATIRLMSIVNGEKTARNLCVHCLADVKKQLPNLDFSSLDSMLTSLLAATKKAVSSGEPEIDLTCPSCQMHYEEFQKTGMLGCAACYDAFREPLEELLKRIHGQTQHTGHAPGVLSEKVTNRLTIMNLKQQLNRAIEMEDYEHAASIRDQIRALTDAEMQEAKLHD